MNGRNNPRCPQPVAGTDVARRAPLRDGRRLAAGAVVLAAATLAVYANAITNPFHFDDISVILNDPRVQDFQLPELLTGPYWYLPNTDRLYRPLPLLSYAANWAIAPQAWAFRLPNLAMHAAVAVLVLALVWRICDSYPAALGAGLAFAIHPLHTEPLNTIIGRADLMVTLLMLAAAVLYWDDESPAAKRRALRPVLAAVCLALALLCKENAVTLIGLVAVLDCYRAGRGDLSDRRAFRLRRLLRCYAPMVAIIGAYLVIRVQFLGSLTTGGDVIDYFENPIAHSDRWVDPDTGGSGALVRWATPLAALAHAVRLAVAPTALCFDYSYAAFEPVRRFGDPRLWAGVGVLAWAAVAAVWSARRKRRVALAIAMSAITYSVVSNTVVLIGTVFGERLLYLPNVGYCVLLGLATGFAFRRASTSTSGLTLVSGRVVAVGLIVLGAWYALLTVERNRDWRSNRALYASAYEVNPRSCKTLAGMALNALEDGDLRQALAYCNEVMQPDAVPEYWPVWRTAGRVLQRMGARASDPQQGKFYTEQALAYYSQALKLGAGGDPDAVLGAADLLIELNGNYQEAIRMARELLGYRPNQARAHGRLAKWLVSAQPAELRDPQQALAHARQACRLKPAVANYQAALADALAALGRTEEALEVIHQALQTLPPDSPGVAEFRQRLQQLQP